MSRISALVFLVLSCTAFAQVPITLGYQARLSTSTGAPVNGAQTITFALYDLASGGTALWSETQTLTISGGELSVSLGESVAIPEAIFARRLFLGIKVGSDPEMTPRPKLNAAPYSVKSRSVLRNTIYVPANGTALENGNALKLAASTVGNNGAIVLDAGEYDLGTDGISLPNRATLRGQGRFSSWVYSANSEYTIRLAGFQVQLKNLRVSNFAPTAVGSNTATVLVADGANGTQIQDVNIETVATGSAVGAHTGLMVRDVDGVRVFNAAVVVNSTALDIAGIAAVSPGSASNSLTIESVTVNSSGSGNSVTAMAITDHTNVLIRDVRANASGAAASSTTLLARNSTVRLENTLLQPNGGGAGAVIRAVHQIDSSLEIRTSQLTYLGTTGAEVYGIDGQFSPPATRRELSMVNSRVNVAANLPTMVGLRLAGIRLVAEYCNFSVVSTGGTPSSVVGLNVLPDTTGAPSAFLPIRYSSWEVRHAQSNDLGAAIITEKTDIFLEESQVFASDDGIEAGLSGNASNVNGVVRVSGGYVQSGNGASGVRSSIRKHQNWSVVSRGVEYTGTFLSESGGSLNCLATTRSGGGDTFLASGCPL